MVPKLRFREFDGAWREKKIEEIFSSIAGGGTPAKDDSYWVGNIPWISSSDVSEDSITGIDVTRFISESAIKNSATKLIPRDSVLVVSRVGVGKVAISKFELCTSQDFTNLIGCEGSPCFYAYLLSHYMKRKASSVQGTAIKGIPSAEIKGYSVFAPDLGEQEKIASFFTLLDKKIALAEQNILKFSLVKDSLLKSVFHRNFLAANGDFRVEKLGDISSIKGGFGFPVSIQGQETKEIPFFKVSDMNGEGNEKELSIARNYITKETASNNKLKPFDDDGIVFAKVGAALLLERRRIARAPYLIDNNMMSVIPRDPENLEYLYYFLCSVRMANFSQSGALPSLNARHVSGIEVPIPSNEKIKSISNLFKEIDKKIILARKKKQTLDRMKQALLQKMFV